MEKTTSERYLFVLAFSFKDVFSELGWLWDLELMAPIEQCYYNEAQQYIGKPILKYSILLGETKSHVSPLIALNRAGPNGERLTQDQILEMYYA